jgi:proteasome accessory factor B
MQKIKPAEDSFTMPPGFSLESYLRHSFGMFTEELVRVKIRFHKFLTRYLLERRWHPSQKNKKLKDGSLELTFEVAGTKEITTWIMGLRLPGQGPRTEVFGQRTQRGSGEALRFYAK